VDVRRNFQAEMTIHWRTNTNLQQCPFLAENILFLWLHALSFSVAIELEPCFHLSNYENRFLILCQVDVITTIGYLSGAPRLDIYGFSVYHKNRLILVNFLFYYMACHFSIVLSLSEIFLCTFIS
jgi:hypothetical protein